MTIGWEDFPVGRSVTTPSVTITETHVVQFGTLTGDWYWLHMNAAAAARGPFGQRIAHGPLTFVMAVGLMYQSQAYGDCILAWLGANNLRATAPVRFGDTIHVVATVTEARQSKQPDRGVVTLNYVVRNQNDKAVMSFDFTLLMRSRS
ncbi:MAG: MaoC/PaaZ C-terminal domain-containing protein [Candidatus Binataceae bacterium]